MRARAHLRALMTAKSCAVEMRNAILRNYLKGNLYSEKAVTLHATNQCRWWKIVFSFKAGEDVFMLNNGDSRLNHLMHDVACSQGQNRCSHPCRRSLWLRWGERKPKAIVWQIFRERYSKQFLYFVKVNANEKSTQLWLSDMYQEVSFNWGTEVGGGDREGN